MATAQPDERNPFRAPTASIRPPTIRGEIPEAEAIRRIYLGHEASVKSLGSLSYLVATFSLIGFVVYALAAVGMVDLTGRNDGGMTGLRSLSSILAGVALLGVVSYGGMGYGLTHLQPWARWVTVILAGLACLWATLFVVRAAFGLAFGPIPLLVSLALFSIPAYILYLVLSAKAAMVFSREYREVVRQTPHVAYKTSRGLKVAFALLVLIVVGAFIAVLNR